MKKNILFVIDSLSSGGAEKSLISLLNLFDYDKYDVDLLLFSRNGLYMPLIPKEVNLIDTPKYLSILNRSVINLIRNKQYKELFTRLMASIDTRNIYLKKKFHSAQITWRWTSKIIEEIDKVYDVAIAYSQGMPTYYVANKVKAGKKICWVNTDYKKAGYNSRFDEDYYEKFEHIIAVSEHAHKTFIEEHLRMKNKVKIIYDIISPKLIRKLSNENDGFKDEYNGTKILTIGRLVYLKGYDMAIDAALQLKKSDINYKWYVIGEGSLETELKRKVLELGLEEQFKFIGVYYNPYVFIKQCDLYVQPSRFEGFGMAVAEAKILNKPVIATNFEAINKQLKNGVNGIVVDTNSQNLYEGINKILQDNKLYKTICKNLNKEDCGTESEIDKIYSIIQ